MTRGIIIAVAVLITAPVLGLMEILAFILLALFTAMGIILAVFVLSVWVLVEKVVDGVKVSRRRA